MKRIDWGLPMLGRSGRNGWRLKCRSLTLLHSRVYIFVSFIIYSFTFTSRKTFPTLKTRRILIYFLLGCLWPYCLPFFTTLESDGPRTKFQLHLPLLTSCVAKGIFTFLLYKVGIIIVSNLQDCFQD